MANDTDVGGLGARWFRKFKISMLFNGSKLQENFFMV
jgi:hypothetical protein